VGKEGRASRYSETAVVFVARALWRFALAPLQIKDPLELGGMGRTASAFLTRRSRCLATLRLFDSWHGTEAHGICASSHRRLAVISAPNASLMFW